MHHTLDRYCFFVACLALSPAGCSSGDPGNGTTSDTGTTNETTTDTTTDTTTACDPLTQPGPEWGWSKGACRRQCAAIGGSCASGAACPSGTQAAIGVVYDCAACCLAIGDDAGTGECTPGEVCRPAVDACDVPETCTADGVCPADTFAAAGTECRAAAGACDVAEVCTGQSAACPADAVQPSTYVCRASTGGCDVAEKCNGAAKACPADAVQPSTHVCRASTGGCDLTEKCNGTGKNCPSDASLPSPDWGVSGGVCLPSCGYVGGTSCGGGCGAGTETLGPAYDCAVCCASPPPCVSMIPAHTSSGTVFATEWSCTEQQYYRLPTSMNGLSAARGRFAAILAGIDVTATTARVFTMMHFVDGSGNEMNYHLNMWKDGATTRVRIDHKRWINGTTQEKIGQSMTHNFVPNVDYFLDCSWDPTQAICSMTPVGGTTIGAIKVPLFASFGAVAFGTGTRGFMVGSNFYGGESIGPNARVKAVRYSLLAP